MQFTVRERTIKCTNEKLIGDNADYAASFSFDAEWEGKVKTARFQHVNLGTYVDVILQDDACTIPAAILKTGYIRIGVFTDEMASTYCEAYIFESIKEKNGNVVAPTPDVYAQIISMLESGSDGTSGKDGKDGIDGQDGITYTPVIGTVTTLDSGTPATASVGLEGTNAVFSFGIPKGDKGDKGSKGDTGEKGADGVNGKDGANGKDGQDGTSVTHSWNGTILTITSASGTSFADLKGAKGEKGDAGTNYSVSVVNVANATEYEISPNVFYDFGTVNDLYITLATPSSESVLNEYMFTFIAGTSAEIAVDASAVAWASEFDIESGKKYQCSIVDGIGVMVGVEV